MLSWIDIVIGALLIIGYLLKHGNENYSPFSKSSIRGLYFVGSISFSLVYATFRLCFYKQPVHRSISRVEDYYKHTTLGQQF